MANPDIPTDPGIVAYFGKLVILYTYPPAFVKYCALPWLEIILVENLTPCKGEREFLKTSALYIKQAPSLEGRTRRGSRNHHMSQDRYRYILLL
ncbi:MAG: hypothetical protein ABI472_21060 [Ginsengibacter sp.]